jgi:outer membrane protein TolC
MTRRGIRLAASFSVLSFGIAGTSAQSADRISLDEALRLARAANARLPIAAVEVGIAEQRRAEARAGRWLKVALEGDFIYAPASGYDPILTNLGEERQQIVLRQPIYEGGARRAAVAEADARIAASRARLRAAERDVELEVRSRFSELVEARDEEAIRREGIERLRTYRTSLESRRTAGQGLAADILKTDIRIAAEEESVLDAGRRAEEARLELNDLIGRDPAAPLEPEPPPEPEEPAAPAGEPWIAAPELAEAQAEVRAADAAVATARSERRPRVSVAADAGFWGSDTTRLIPPDLEERHPGATFSDRVRRDAGYSFRLEFSWSVWDFGAMQARIAQSELSLEEARRRVELERRRSRLEWSKADEARRSLYRSIRLLSRSAPDARDAYLAVESRYRGGTATSLEVLDAYAASIEAAVRLANAVARYRIADATRLRWGSP